MVERCRYAVEEIGRALEKAAERVSAWKSSEALDLPFATVRDWRRRWQERAPAQLAEHSRLALRVGAEIKELPTRPLAALVAVLKVAWREPGSGKRIAVGTEIAPCPPHTCMVDPSSVSSDIGIAFKLD